MDRLIPKTMIPATLWNENDSLMYLPPQLIKSWELLLDRYCLREKALAQAPKGFEGGMSEEATKDHLAWRFTGSCARTMLSMLDPHEELTEISDAFARIFSGNRVFLADLPCGSGAASMSILSVFCELRRQSRIPRMPLEVVIVGGEISKYAQKYASEGLDSLVADLESQAITIKFEMVDWDVCDPFSNTDLIKNLTLSGQEFSSKLLILANFSGFLERENKWKKAQAQFEELFRHSRDKNSIALWIEPSKSNVKNGFAPRIYRWFTNLFSPILQIKEGEEKVYAESNTMVKHPLKKGAFRSGLVVMRFDLPSGSQK